MEMEVFMEQITVTEIRRRIGAILLRVARGESFTIVTGWHRTPVAVLAPDSGKAQFGIAATWFVKNLAEVLHSITAPVGITSHGRTVAELRPPDAINEPA
jgi:antitoxin (DNA-binding transcriptional repressor) of toxin-antitoxin stability system